MTSYPAFVVTAAALLGVWAPAGVASVPDGSGVASACSVNGAAVTLRVSAAGQAARCSFGGRTGQRVNAAITGVATSDGGCETLSLLTPKGQNAGSASGCGDGNPVGAGPVTLTSTGTWAVQLKLDPTATGSARLWVSVPASAGTVTVNGPAVSLPVPHPGREPERTFSGKKGQRVKAAITGVTTSDNGCETLSLLSPQGQSAGYASGCGDGNPVSVGPVTLTAGGTWAVLLQLDPAATGSARLKVSRPG